MYTANRTRSTIEFHNMVALSLPAKWTSLDFGNIDWKFFLDYATRNKTFVRLTDRLVSNGIKLPALVEDAYEKRLQRNVKALETIERVSERFQRENIQFAMLKFADSYPDMGRDNDFFVGENFEHAVEVVKSFQPTPNSVSLSDTINKKKRSFFIEGVEIEVYGKITQLGENYFTSGELLNNREWLEVGENRIPVSRAHIRLLYSCVHSTLRHRHVKFSEILGALRIFKSSHLAWQETLQVAKRIGIMIPLKFYLAMTSTLATTYGDGGGGLQMLPDWMQKFPAHVPKVDFAEFYGLKFLSDLSRADFMSALRLSAAPLVGTFSEVLAATTTAERGVW